MLVDYLHRAAIRFPDHPICKQELTVTFTCWLAHIERLLTPHATFPIHPTLASLEALWEDWQIYQDMAN